MIKQFDFHTHILPGIDDGSKSVEESLAMIRELSRQGAYGIAATPHFYASSMSPESFFKNRAAAWEKLKPYLNEDTPEIRLGAEVQYFEGMHHMKEIERFCLEGTHLLLVEMPTMPWTNRMVTSVLELNGRLNITVLLAHIERYLSRANKKAFEVFREEDVLMQASTAFFYENPRTAMKMLKKDQIHFLGTDCHNMTKRRPNMEQALKNIQHRKGKECLRIMREREELVLSGKTDGFFELYEGETGLLSLLPF